MSNEQHSELAIPDLQRRLMVLGHRLGTEADKGLYGEKTAAAVASFKEATGLGFDDVVDQTTWTALKDASMQIGDRLLYLHMPPFHGRDVGDLQDALSSMGFACALDSTFGPETEQALRDFQANYGLAATGIMDEATHVALLRLSHIWEGKRGLYLEGRSLEIARPQRVLESTPICVFGSDGATRGIANRVANLARATTSESKLASASTMATAPGRDMLVIGLEQAGGSGESTTREAGDSSELPVVRIGTTDTWENELRCAIHLARSGQNRVTVQLDGFVYTSDDAAVQNQEVAVTLLDGICRALEQ